MPTTAADLLGTWQLVAWEIDVGGRLVRPFGTRPVGLLSYTPDGWMQATIAAAERPGLSGPSARSSPDVEVAATARTYFSYAGRWWLQPAPDPDANVDTDGAKAPDVDVEVVCHEVVLALDPAMVGTIQRRRAHLTDDQLTLAAAEPVGSTTRHHRLVWQPASPTAPPTPTGTT